MYHKWCNSSSNTLTDMQAVSPKFHSQFWIRHVTLAWNSSVCEPSSPTMLKTVLIKQIYAQLHNAPICTSTKTQYCDL